MKKVKYFMFAACPHCRKASRLLDELRQDPRYADVEIEQIDENMHPEIAEQYDYYYVPTFFVDGVKLHEGRVNREDVEKVLRYAAAPSDASQD